MLNKPAIIECPRIILKSITPDDKQTAIVLLQNKEISKTYMMPDFKNEEAVAKLFGSFMRLSEEPSRFVYGIYFDNKLIGFLNETGKDDKDMELGYMLDPEYWGRGFATEALENCIKVLFDMGYESVTTGYFEENVASKRVMQKCSMIPLEKEESIEYRGVVHRCLYYRIYNPRYSLSK